MNSELLKLEKEFLRLYCRFHPTTATSLGLSRHIGEFPNYSEGPVQVYLRQLSRLRRRLKTLGKFRRGSDDFIDSWLLNSKILIEEKELKDFQLQRRDPSLYLNEILYGLWFIWVRPFSKREKLKGMKRRMAKIPRLLSQAQGLLTNPPEVWRRIALQELEALKDFLKDCHRELDRMAPGLTLRFRAISEGAERAVDDFHSFLKETLKKRRRSPFAVGKKNFNFLLKNYHGFSETSGKILKIGKDAYQTTKRQMDGLSATLRKGKKWESWVDEVKKDHPTEKNLIPTYRKAVRKTLSFLKRRGLVGIPAGENLKVVETPLFARSTIPFAAYIDPPLFATDRTGTFFVTPVNEKDRKRREELLREHCRASLAVTALHEGYPGHHLQFVYQANLKRPIRKLFNCSSYYEGWALYCEEMMAEEGFYDEETRLLQLKDRLWRACRVIVDVGMHTEGLSDAAAVGFLARHARMAKASARADVNWYTQRPTVPQSYMTGMLKIMALREKARKKWGRGFSLKRFHDWFLGFGAIPVPLIESALSS